MSYPFPPELQAWIFLISFAVILFGCWSLSAILDKNDPNKDDYKERKEKKNKKEEKNNYIA